jgi:hypothetical protein
MTYQALLMILIGVITRQFGWFGSSVALAVAQAPMPTGDVPPNALAAPSELKTALIALVNSLIDQIPQPLARLVLRQATSAIPAVIDQVWDQLFNKSKVGCAYLDHPEAQLTAVAPFDDAIPAEILADIGA